MQVQTMSGQFISFEGIDGAGKSSHIAPLADALRARGVDVLVTREPGGTPLAEKLRSLILNEAMDPLTEVMLVFAARRDHLRQLIEPAIARGTTVLCDRFTDSTFAYQGAGRRFDLDVLCQFETLTQTIEGTSIVRQPDLTLWFDLDPAAAAQRLAGSRAPDRFESETSAFFASVRQGYLGRCAQYPERIARIDAGQSPQDVYKEVLETVLPFAANCTETHRRQA